MLGLRGRAAIAARGNGSGAGMLRYARPHNLNGNKFGRRRRRRRRRQHSVRLHQYATVAFVLLVLRLIRFASDGNAILASEDHPAAGANGHLAAVFGKRKPVCAARMRMGQGARKNIEEEDQNAKGDGSLAPKRAAALARQSVI